METNLYPIQTNGFAVQPVQNNFDLSKITLDQMNAIMTMKLNEEMSARFALVEQTINKLEDKIDEKFEDIEISRKKMELESKRKEKEYQAKLFEASVMAADTQFGDFTEIGHAIEPSISRINVRKLLVYSKVIQNNEKDVVPTQKFLNNGSVEKVAFKRRTLFNNGQYHYMWVFNIKLVWKKIMECMQKDGILNDFNSLKTTKERNDFIRANFSK